MFKMLLLVLLLCPVIQNPHCFNRNSLTNYDAKISRIKGDKNAVANIVWLGDSLTVQEFTTAPLRSRLQSEFGNAGLGFIRFDSSGYPTGAGVTSFGVWKERDELPSASGLHVDDSTSSEKGARKIVYTGPGYDIDSINLVYIKQPTKGAFRYKIDDGEWYKVKTKGKLKIAAKHIQVEPGNHFLTVEVVNGTVTLIGADYGLGNRGVKLHMIGNTGSKASQWAGVDATLWQQGLAALNPTVVVIQFSTNEQSQLESPAVMIEAYKVLISRIRAAAPDADIILTTDPDTAHSANPVFHSTKEYSDTVKELAATVGIGFMDFYGALGSYRDANIQGFYDDIVHPSRAGGRMLADAVYQYLNGGCN
jgi:lysophospholipase L1-like esterase